MISSYDLSTEKDKEYILPNFIKTLYFSVKIEDGLIRINVKITYQDISKPLKEFLDLLDNLDGFKFAELFKVIDATENNHYLEFRPNKNIIKFRERDLVLLLIFINIFLEIQRIPSI